MTVLFEIICLCLLKILSFKPKDLHPDFPMMYRVFGFFTDVFCFQRDRFLTVILCLLAVVFFFSYSHLMASKRGKTLFWIGSALLIFCVVFTVGVSVWRFPHGLSGSYYDNPSWAGEPVPATRYFETPGRRVDRFIAFNPNDFNDRYPFSGNPFSIQWQGHVYIPGDSYQLGIESNFGTWLYVDDTLIEGPHKIDFGTPEARTYLREGWSVNEQWGEDPNLSFVWSSGRRSEFYLGVDACTDYTLIFRCIPFFYEGSPTQELTISINGVFLETIALQDGWSMYALPVPRSLLQDITPGFFRVRFTYSNVIRPSEVIAQSKDGRQIAVAFDFAAMLRFSGHVDTSGDDATPAFTQSPLVSQGLHRITLHAQTQGSDPFIKFTWRQGRGNTSKVIPEDYLFPETLSPDSIQHSLPGERILLGVAIGYKIIVVIFLGSLVLAYGILPHFKRVLTWNSLWLGGITALALGMLVCFLFESRKIDPTFYILPHGTDQLNYVFFARGFLRGYWPWYADFPLRFNPLVSLFLIVTHSLLGEDLLMNKLLIALMSAVAIPLLYSLARNSFNTPVAIIASLLCALNGVYIFYGVSLLVAPHVTFLNILLLWYVHRIARKFSSSHAVVLGILFGILALGRATFLLFLPFLFFWIFWKQHQNFFRKLAYCLIISCTVLLVISPITFLNYSLAPRHQFVLITDAGGLNLWIGNNRKAEGDRNFDEKFFQETRDHMKATGNTYVDEVWLFMTAQPVDYLKLQWKKCIMFWRGYEIANLMPYYLFRENSSLLRLPFINFVILGPLSIVGLLLTSKKWKHLYLLQASVFVQVVINVAFLTLARYRIPAVPVLSIFAAYTLFSVYDAFRKRQFLSGLLVVFLCITLYAILNYPYAARLYEEYHHTKMPLIKMPRYWDLFRFYGP